MAPLKLEAPERCKLTASVFKTIRLIRRRTIKTIYETIYIHISNILFCFVWKLQAPQLQVASAADMSILGASATRFSPKMLRIRMRPNQTVRQPEDIWPQYRYPPSSPAPPLSPP